MSNNDVIYSTLYGIGIVIGASFVDGSTRITIMFGERIPNSYII